MSKIVALKSKLNKFLLAGVVVVLSTSAYLANIHMESNTIEKALVQAKNLTNQLLITRNYLSSVAPYITVDNTKINDFAITPAFVGSHISKQMIQESNTYIKQTSLRYRNIKNQPDAYETKILQKYDDEKIIGEHWEVTTLNNKNVLRYSKPLYIRESCLNCHGVPHVDVQTKTYEKLIAIYGDKSFNYAVGDIRGIISVAIPVEFSILNSDELYTVFFIIMILSLYIFIERKYIFMPQYNKIINNEEYEQAVIESNNNAIIAINWQGKITTYNKKAEDMFGWSKDEMLGKNNLSNIIPSEYRQLHKEASTNYFKTGVSCGILGNSHELTAVKKDGTVFPIKISFGSKYKGKDSIVVANISDISKEKEQEHLLKDQTNKAIKASKIKSEFLANMSHEIRTPLNAIMGFIQLLQAKEEDQKKKKYLNIINSSSKNLLTIINDILDISKIESGNLELEKIDFNPTKEFNLTKELFKAKMDEKSISFHSNFSGFPDLLNGDIHKLKQVINNLLSNAVKFTPENKNIYLDIQYKDKFLNISVKDEGIGINEKYHTKIFEPFSQEDSSTTRQYGGTGLGLAISYKIIKAMGSELKLKSELDKGSEFYCSIPFIV
ncbi:MAG: DUF3365 domain-containing protein [Campylobacterota bacterium]|nr:DUF3365 domain-containing protein [Campylobacterota bacterium]